MTPSPTLSTDVLTSYSEQRITDVLGRESDELVVRVYGQNQDVLENKAEEVQAAIPAGIDGVENVAARGTAARRAHDRSGARHRKGGGRSACGSGDVRRAATTLLSGLVVGNLFEEQKVFDVAGLGTPEVRENCRRNVENLLIDTPNDGPRAARGRSG